MCHNRECLRCCDCRGTSSIPPPTVLCCFIFVLCCLIVALQFFVAMKMFYTSKQFTNLTNMAYRITEAIENSGSTEKEGWIDMFA